MGSSGKVASGVVLFIEVRSGVLAEVNGINTSDDLPLVVCTMLIVWVLFAQYLRFPLSLDTSLRCLPRNVGECA